MLVRKWGTYRLKQWITLESHKEKILKAVESGSTEFPKHLLTYLSTAFWGVNSKWYDQADWMLLVRAFSFCLSKSPKVELPIASPSDEKYPEADWDYPNRTWHLYSHMIAKTYGWTFSEISQLHVLDALATIQEIIVDEQLGREFQYGLSEMAYSYDKNSKTSKFNPLPRPHWMRKRIQPIKKTLIPASMLPMGNVIMDGIPEEYYPKEVKLN